MDAHTYLDPFGKSKIRIELELLRNSSYEFMTCALESQQ